MGDKQNYGQAVQLIKTAILQSQYDAARSVNKRQLMLYYGIGKYVSMNSRNGFWGKGALETISQQLEKELPGLRGFSARNLRYMRMFYEEWSELDLSGESSQIEQKSNLALTSAKSQDIRENEIWHLQVPKADGFPEREFFSIGFTHRRIIFEKVKNKEERYFYIRRCYDQKYTVDRKKYKGLKRTDG